MATVNENVNIKINIEGDKASASLKDYRNQMKELRVLQVQYNAAVESGDVKLQASLKARMSSLVQMKNDMKDVKTQMQYLDPGELLGGWIKMTQGVVGSFAAISGAMSLFGDESEEIQKIEKKSMTLIQTMMGLEQMRALLDKRDGQARLRGLIENTAAQYKEITAMITKNLVITTTTKTSKAAAAAQWLWNAAVTAFPLVALVAGVAALSYGIYKLIDAQKEQISVLNVSQDLQKKQGENAASELVQLDAMVKKLKDAKDNKKEYSAVVKQWNEKYGKEYNASLSTTVFNLDAITSAANKAREAILKKALAAAAEEKLKEIVSDNITMYETYITATESLSLKKAALAKEEEMYAYFIEQGMTDAAAAQYMYIKSLKDKIAVGYEAYGLDKDYVKEIEVLTQVVANNTFTTQNQTTATKDYGTAVKDTTKDAKDLKKEFEEPIEFTISVDKGPQQITEEIAKLKREWVDARNQIKSESLFRALEGEEWDIVKEKMMDYYGQGIINEEDYNKTLIKYSALNQQANEEAYEFGLITYEEFEKNKIVILSESIKKQTDMYAGYVTDVASQLSSIFSNLTEMMTMQIEYEDKLYQDRYNTRNEALNNSLENAKKVWGEESKQYKALLQEQINLDNEKKTHDDNIEKEKKAAQNKYAKAQLVMQMAQTTANFAQGIAGIWATELGTKGVLGTPIAIAMTALLSSVYATQMALMTKQMSMVGKMRKGGYISGASHEQGGVLRELEGGEAVVNKRSMEIPAYRNLVSAINVAGGGVPYPNANGIGQSSALTASIDSSTIETIVESVTNRIAAIPVIVTESDITTTQRKVSVIKNRTTLG